MRCMFYLMHRIKAVNPGRMLPNNPPLAPHHTNTNTSWETTPPRSLHAARGTSMTTSHPRSGKSGRPHPLLRPPPTTSPMPSPPSTADCAVPTTVPLHLHRIQHALLQPAPAPAPARAQVARGQPPHPARMSSSTTRTKEKTLWSSCGNSTWSSSWTTPRR